MSDANINNMDIKQLRNEVQLLRDELAIMERKYEDILYNLDDNNFSSRLVQEKDNMKTQISITAEGIETKVSKDEFNSQINQINEEIAFSVNTFGSEISSLTLSTSGISSKVNRIEDGKFNGYTLFKQTDDKFSFTGNVEISGDTIVGGTIKGSSLQNDEGTHTLQMKKSIGSVGEYGTFCLYNQYYDNVPYFSVYDNTFGGIELFGAGERFIMAKTQTPGVINVTALGNWDFSEASVTLPDGVGGGTSGTAVAVFG